MMGGFGMMGWAWVWPVILVLGLAALVWGLTHARRSPPSGGTDREDRARQILRERYARGDISEEEMRERMRALDEG